MHYAVPIACVPSVAELTGLDPNGPVGEGTALAANRPTGRVTGFTPTGRAALKGDVEAYDVASAKAAALQGRTEEWVHAYLNGPGRNTAFSQGLRLRQRFWRGPIEVPIAALERTCGPEPDLPFPVTPESWTTRQAALQADFESVEMFSPLIVQYESGRLLIRDGNHRHGAYEALGLERCWIVLWYADETERTHHELRGFRI